MSKTKRWIVALLAACMVLALAVGFVGCGSRGSSRTTYTGHYYPPEEINGVKRGCDIVVILNADNSIYTISEDEESDYVLYDVEQLWGIFSNLNFYPNLCSVSVEEINSWTVACDENGLPTAVEGMPEEWLVTANTGACGMVVLALQDAFSQIK